MSALSSHSEVLSALGSRSAGLSALAILSHAHVRQPPPDDKFASAACGCRQRASVMAGGVPIVSYLVDECCDFIGRGGEGGGERTTPTVRNLQRKSRIVRVFLGSS